MANEDISPWLLRIARPFRWYLLIGLLVVISAVGLGIWEAAALPMAPNPVETVIRVINPALSFLGIGVLTFGIGMSIVIIIYNLTGAARDAVDAYQRAFPASPLSMPKRPWFAGTFAVLLFGGLAFALTNFFFALSGGLAAAGLAGPGVPGFTAASWGAFVEVLRTPQRPGTLSFIALGIGLGLATIVYNLRLQARLLPGIIGGLSAGNPAEVKGVVAPTLPRLPSALIFAGWVIVLSASYPIGFLGALARADLVAGIANPTAAQTVAWTTGVFPVIAVTGIVTLLGGVVYWLLLIIQALRDQRSVIGRIGSALAGYGAQPLEQTLWPEKVAVFLAGGALLTLLLLFVPAVLNVYLRWEILRLAGSTGAAFVNLQFLTNFLTAFVPNMRFVGIALVMLAIGLALGIILINLRGMGMILPGTMARILQAKGQEVDPAPVSPDEGDVEERAEKALSRFPTKLFLPLLVGALIMITTAFPLTVPFHSDLQLQWRDAMEAGDQELAAQLTLDMKVLASIREPWNFVGMGLVFFAIGQFFGTIIGFVQARKVVIADVCDSLAVPSHGSPGGEGTPSR
ncbi:MAG: hypothetical protein LN413_05785 [Candidatus Thermoplasmatota archaeon]|nr:hypothetical protein [Candidatus Thermoplasmatota archaeon]